MAKRVEGVTEKLLESAKKEFLNFVIYSKGNSIALKYFHQMSRKKRL